MGGAVKGLMNRPFGLFRWYYYGRSEVGGSDHAAMRAERAGAMGIYRSGGKSARSVERIYPVSPQMRYGP